MKTGPVYKAVFGVAGVLLLSRLLGFVREMVVANKFGTSADYDLYLIAIMFSALAYGILNYAGYYLFVPYLTRKLTAAERGGDEAPDFWPLVNTSLMAAVAAVVLIILAAPYLLKLWAQGYVAEDFGRIVLYSRLTAVAVLLGVGEAFMRAFLNVRRIYTYPAAGYIVFNTFSILSIVFLADRYGIGALAFGWIGGLFVQNVFLWFRLIGQHKFGGYHTRVFNAETKYLLTTASALIVIELINRSYFLIDRYFAPQFGEGIVSALNYSQVLVQLPDSIVGFAIGAVMFPIFSANAGEENRVQFAALYRKTILAALLLAVPLAVFIFVNAPDLIFLLFQRGVFDPHSTELTATVLRPHIPAMVALFIVSTSIRACYSGGWIRAVFWFTVFMFLTKFVATALFGRWFGYAGISAGTSAAQVGFALLLMFTVLRRVSVPGAGRFILAILRTVLAGIAAGAVLWYGEQFLPGALQQMTALSVIVKFAISGVVLIGLYVLFVRLLGGREHLSDLVGSRFTRATGGGGDA